jgi:site-specific recombinase XerD
MREFWLRPSRLDLRNLLTSCLPFLGDSLVGRTGFEPVTNGLKVPISVSRLLNKLGVTELAELSNLSKSYISQVKHGKCPPSQKLVDAILEHCERTNTDSVSGEKVVSQFLDSRREGISLQTIAFYRHYLTKAIAKLGLSPKTSQINYYLAHLNCSSGGKHAYFRAIRVFYNWLYSPSSGLKLRPEDNPILWVDAPKLPRLIMPSLSSEQVHFLIDTCPNLRDKTIIALLTESGLRLSEVTNIKVGDIDWQNRIIRVLGKGRKEAYAPFGQLSENYLRTWLAQYSPKGNIWGLNQWGIVTMLRRLEEATSLPCNPHTFRRTFACLLRKAGVDTMTIKDLGRWESLEMVQKYTRSITFQDSLKFYRAPLS